MFRRWNAWCPVMLLASTLRLLEISWLVISIDIYSLWYAVNASVCNTSKGGSLYIRAWKSPFPLLCQFVYSDILFSLSATLFISGSLFVRQAFRLAPLSAPRLALNEKSDATWVTPKDWRRKSDATRSSAVRVRPPTPQERRRTIASPARQDVEINRGPYAGWTS